MEDVYKLLALAFAAAVLIIAGMVGIRVYQDVMMIWYILVVVGACALIVSTGLAVALGYDRRSNFLRRQQEFEDDRKAQRVSAAAILRALATANAAGGTGGAQTWTDTVKYLLRDIAAEDMADDVAAGIVPDLPGATHLLPSQNGHGGAV